MPSANTPSRLRGLALLLLGGLAALPLARAQRPEAPTETPRPPAEEPDRQARLAQARIEVRILEGRLGVKQAELKVEEARLEFARQLKKNTESNARSGYQLLGAASVAAIDALNEEARVVAKKAELDEASLRYQEAKRRLDAGELPPRTEMVGLADLDRRLTEMERAVDQLNDRVFGMSRSKLKASYMNK